MIINREWASPNKWTFTIKPIKELLERYVGDGEDWIDPYAGKYSMAELTNDINPEMPTVHHLDALAFVERYEAERFDGVLFDPPYSYRQVSEHYKRAGIKPNRKDTSYNFYRRVMLPLDKMLKKGGHVISFGWNSSGFGKTLGYEIVEILLVAHGLHHNDTIVTVERKL